jgi:membrane protein DedA with SNARE-associated domain
MENPVSPLLTNRYQCYNHIWFNHFHIHLIHMDEVKPEAKDKSATRVWIGKRLVPLAGLFISIVIIVGVVFIYLQNRQIVDELEGWGYLGAFILSVVMNATVILPVSVISIVIALGATLPNPIYVGLAAGIGAGIGEMTGYLVGRSGRGLLAKSSMYTRLEKWVKKWGWIAIFLISIVPFAFDVVGIIAGALRMPVWRFFVACWLGRSIIYVAVAWAASMGIKLLPWYN